MKTDVGLLRIERQDLESQLGHYVKVVWAKPGCIWRLVEIDNDMVMLRSDGGKEIWVPADDVCYSVYNRPSERMLKENAKQG